MALHVFVLLLVVCILLTLALLWRLDWFPLQSSHFKTGAMRTRVHRLLKPHPPDNCQACRLASTASSDVTPASGEVASLV